MGKNAPQKHQNPTPVGQVKSVKSNTGEGGYVGTTKAPTTQKSADYSK